MNTRCYRCGWSFTLSREALEEAAVSSAGQKAHTVHCPRCRQAIRIPMDQIMRALPPDWAAPVSAAEPATMQPASAEPVASAMPPSGALEQAGQPQRRGERRHRHSGKTPSGDSAAVQAAKKSTHPS